jgi:NADH-quinone oxidoreductase subunit A
VPSDYYPVLLALGVALLLGSVLALVHVLAGGRSRGRIKLSPYESGMPLLDRSHKRMSIVFFLIALDFVVFDVEAAFLYPWALVIRDGGWPLFWAVMGFVGLILVGYVYVWKRGGLELRTRLPEAEPQARRAA